MLELIDVTKSYQSSAPAPADASQGAIYVLKGITLRMAPGQALVIAGPSGSGKSTLLNIIGALDRPTSGKVLLEGSDLAKLSEEQLARIRSQQIGFVFQLHHLLPQCTVLENVLVPTLAGYDSAWRKESRQRAVNLLGRVGLTDCLLRRPGELSVGQRQRTAVVRALINKPRLLLADEPTGSLDETTAQSIADLLVELQRSEKVALLVVTHSTKLAERIGPVMELSGGVLAYSAEAAAKAGKERNRA